MPYATLQGRFVSHFLHMKCKKINFSASVVGVKSVQHGTKSKIGPKLLSSRASARDYNKKRPQIALEPCWGVKAQ